MNREGVTEDKYRIKFYDCDINERMKTSALLKIFSEIAGHDYTLKGYTHEYLWEREMVFLLSRVSMHIYELPVNQQHVIVRTWECGKKGAMYLRGSDILARDGRKLVDCLGGWVLVNPNTRKIYRPSHFDGGFPQLTDMPMNAPELVRVSAENAADAGSHIVRYSDLDGNGHVYNATYADIAADVLTKEERAMAYSDMRINYIGEAVEGDRIELSKVSEDKRIAVVGTVNGSVCFETEISVCGIDL